MQRKAKSLVALAVLSASQAAWGAAPALRANAQLTYSGESDTGACTVNIVTDAQSRPTSVRLDLLSAGSGNVDHLDATFSYQPLLPVSATIARSPSAYTVSKKSQSAGMVEITTAVLTGDDDAALTTLALTRDFVGVLGATLTCEQLQPL